MMHEETVFDQLVQTLSSEDRVELLNKIQSASPLSYEPLQTTPEEFEPFIPEQELKKLNFWQRFMLFLRSFFTGKDKATLLNEIRLNRLAVEIERQYPGLMNYRAELFTQKMFQELDALKASAQELQNLLNQALEASKEYFFAFLAKNELEYVQQNLEMETDPYTLWDSIRPENENDVKVEMYNRFSEILDTIPAEDKNQIYHDVRTLYALHALSAHSFDELLSRFEADPSAAARRCPFHTLRAALIALTDLLYSAQFLPSPAALRTLSLFYHQEQLEEAGFNLEEQFRRDLARFDSAFSGIRRFNERVPLMAIVQYIARNPNYHPREITGGEDWFVIYKNFLKKRLDRRFQEFVHFRLRQKLTKEVIRFCNLIRLPEIKNYGEDQKHFLSLAFLKGFFGGNFNNLYRALKLIMLKGEFYKEENRLDYTDAFEYCVRIDERVGRLEARLDIGGDLHTLLRSAKADQATQKGWGKRFREIQEQIHKEVYSLIQTSHKQVKKLSLLLTGILRGEPGAQYDTLANFDTIGGRENKILIGSWEQGVVIIEEAGNLLSDILDLELQG